MKKLGLFTALLLAVNLLYAQDALKKAREENWKKIKRNDADTSKNLWKKGGTFNLNANQGSLTNWAAGGDKFSLSAGATLSVFANYAKGRNAWDNTLDLAYGYVKTTSLGMRKSDDRIDLTTKYGYDIGSNWYASALFNLRTQFANGYLYTDTSRQLVSKFFSPAYILLSPGLDYKPNKEFSLFLSPVTGRWVVVLSDSLSARGAYGVDTGRHVKSEFGAYLSANWNKEIMKNIVYKSKLELFSNYKQNPGNVDVFWTNVLSMKVNKYLSATVNLDMIYDDDVKVFENTKTGVMGPRLQIKQVIGIGFAAIF
ncbi:DUF3078 domain-containing protein [Chitinophaga sedimenti]|uniref:DUF3078 domain-containing protein n=1 Tax=Chitinophaga sedimenti TaxID=2033606 RepID=UPI002002B7CC|nr:DUF3078 domain-containing protein [Chitinophaga sedimenti]MCK7559015.1 DUF3078 domain-containing protein [Chitinophaga sedimenti]